MNFPSLGFPTNVQQTCFLTCKFLAHSKGNGRILTETEKARILDILTSIQAQARQDSEGSESDDGKGIAWYRMFGPGYLLTSSVMLFTWVTTTVGSYTLGLNATKLSGDLFVNFLLAAAVEVPSTVMLFFTLKYFKCVDCFHL